MAWLNLTEITMIRPHRALVLLSLAAALPASAADFGVRTSFDDPSWQAKTAAETRPWTREEMLAAVPVPMPEVTEAQLLRAVEEMIASKAYDTSGGPGKVAGGYPEGARGKRGGVDDIVVGDESGLIDDGTGAGFTKGYSYPAPFSRYETLTYTGYPHVAVGKVFFKSGSSSYVCSGAAIGNHGVLTAGHCVQNGDTGTFYTNWIFAPGYKNGTAPYGQWAANHLWVLSGWAANSNFARDVGGAVLNTLGGKKLAQRVGFLGFAWNQGNSNTASHYHAIGYPAASPFNGLKQQICAASFAANGSGFGSPAPFWIGCDLTGGSSGGPWVRSYSGSAGASNYVNGVNSFKRCANSNCSSVYNLEMYSPYFDTTVKNLHTCLYNSVPNNPANPSKNCAAGT